MERSLAAWLDGCGLGRHAAAFAKQGVTADQLDSLTDDDLRELGLGVGDRKHFRTALAGAAGGGLSASPLASPPERRPLTVMFVDLVDSSGLGERLDPEDLVEVLGIFREFASQAIARYGGRVARFIGDGILAYFCYPLANEDDPERAVRAALAIIGGIGAVATPGGPIAVRIGVATGRVVVRELFSGGEPDLSDPFRGLAAVGSTPNLAARLQSLATANGIVIASDTHRRVRDRIACESLGPQVLKGFEQAHHAWRVVGDRIEGSPPTRRHTTLRGRDAEIEVLRAAWARARRGEGGTVLILGEAGIGKSRLLGAMHEPEAAVAGSAIELSAIALQSDTPLHPFVRHFGTLAGADGASPEERLAALGRGLGNQASETLPLMARLIGLQCRGDVVDRMRPAERREGTIAAIIGTFLSLPDPIWLVIEDVHWLDPTSQELVQRLATVVRGHPALLLLTARGQCAPEWLPAEGTTLLPLRRLAPAIATMILDELSAGERLPKAIADRILSRADGVPLFVEEIAQSVLERRRRGAWDDLAAEVADEIVPSSLDESLMARLDRSGVGKRIAQIAAVVGQSVHQDVLADVAELAPHALARPLAALLEVGILEKEASDPQRYTFSHALLHDAAYGSLVREQRRDLHRRVAQALSSHDPQQVALHPEVLALHLAEGGLSVAAAQYWLEAANRSLERSALIEATRMLRRGLADLERLPASPDTVELRLKLSGLLGPVLMSLRGFGGEAQELYANAVALCSEADERPSHFPILWGWWRLSADCPAYLERSRALLQRAERRSSLEFLLQAHHCSWASHYHVGAFDKVCAHVAAGLEIYERGDFRHHARLYGNHDAKVCAHGELMQVRWMQGRPGEALRQEAESAAHSETLRHVGTHAHAMDMRLLHRAFRRDFRAVFALAGELEQFTSEHGLEDHHAKAMIFRGWTTAVREDAAGGLAIIEAGIARQRRIGTFEDFAVYYCLLAGAMLAVSEADRASDMLQRERASLWALGFRFWMPELLRMQGEASLASDPKAGDKAQAFFAEAADLASSQGAGMLRLRAALSMARHARQMDCMTDAATLLRDALSGVEADAGTTDIAAARNLLHGLPSH